MAARFKTDFTHKISALEERATNSCYGDIYSKMTFFTEPEVKGHFLHPLWRHHFKCMKVKQVQYRKWKWR